MSESEKEINTVNSKKDIEELELNMKEKESYKLIQELVDDKNLISRYTLEGHLLYGDLKLTNFRMYHIILSLQNKGLLKSIEKDDGERFRPDYRKRKFLGMYFLPVNMQIDSM